MKKLKRQLPKFGNCQWCKHSERVQYNDYDDFGNELSIDYNTMDKSAAPKWWCNLLNYFIDKYVVDQYNAGYYKEYIVIDRRNDKIVWNEDVSDEEKQRLSDFDPNDDNLEDALERADAVDIAGNALEEDIVLVNLQYTVRERCIEESLNCEYYCP